MKFGILNDIKSVQDFKIDLKKSYMLGDNENTNKINFRYLKTMIKR